MPPCTTRRCALHDGPVSWAGPLLATPAAVPADTAWRLARLAVPTCGTSAWQGAGGQHCSASISGVCGAELRNVQHLSMAGRRWSPSQRQHLRSGSPCCRQPARRGAASPTSSTWRCGPCTPLARHDCRMCRPAGSSGSHSSAAAPQGLAPRQGPLWGRPIAPTPPQTYSE